MNIITLDLNQQYQYEVLSSLKKELDIHLDYASIRRDIYNEGDHKIIQSLQNELFKESTIVEYVDTILFAEKIIEKSDIPWSIDGELLKSLADTELTYLKLSDRNCSDQISVHKRRKYFYILVNHFNSILKTKNIDCAILFETPHTINTNIFYELILKKGIPVIKIEHHQLTEHLMVVNSDINPMLPEGYLETKSKNEIWDSLDDTIKESYKASNTFTQMYINNDKKHIIKANFLSYVSIELKFLRKFIANMARGLFPFLFKKGLQDYNALSGTQSPFAFRMSIIPALRKLVTLQSYYMKISKEVDINEKFIYIGLHMQPEKTSQPLGMYFDHHFLAIKILADALPEGWKLYVKEHPNQFNSVKIPNNNYRDKYFYNAVSNLKNVVWVSLEQNSQQLIDLSQIVATLTGTMGWEALQKGIPVIAFGNSFYSACLAVRRPMDLDQCKESINYLSSLSKDDIEKEVYRYLHYYNSQKNLVKASNSELRFQYSNTPRETQIRLISESIMFNLSKINNT